jgi:hypothetical protein
VSGAFPTSAGEYDDDARGVLEWLERGAGDREIMGHLAEAEGLMTCGVAPEARREVVERIRSWFDDRARADNEARGPRPRVSRRG